MEDIDTWNDKFVLCQYSKSLLNKIIYLKYKSDKEIDIKEIAKAIYYAKKYHGNQMRQSGEPYYSHPLEVASMISEYLFKTDVIVISILHDTIEDTSLTKEMIESLFGSNVAEGVEDLTRIKNAGKISSSELISNLWKEQKYESLLIKQFDRLHNMLTIRAKSPEKINKIKNETLDSFLVLSAYLETRDIENKLIKLCLDLSDDNFENNFRLKANSLNDSDLYNLLLENN